MRDDYEIMKLIQQFIEKDERVRVALLEGSRTNNKVQVDDFQDYDVSCFVTDMDSYLQKTAWMASFGQLIFVKKQTHTVHGLTWMNYVLYYDDGVCIDLKIIPLEEMKDYFEQVDSLIQLLIDKDDWIPIELVANDQLYWIGQPDNERFALCCNEFWHAASNVIKSLYRDEFFAATATFNECLRPELLRLVSWKIGEKYGFNLNLGQEYKLMKCYVSNDVYEQIIATYALQDDVHVWQSFELCCTLFENYSQTLAKKLKLTYPPYADQMKQVMKTYEALVQKNT